MSAGAQTLQLIGPIKERIYPPENLSSGVSSSPLSCLVPTQLLCTFAVNRSQNGRGDGHDVGKSLANSHSAVKH